MVSLADMRGLLEVGRLESSVKILNVFSRNNGAQQVSLNRKPGREFADPLAIQFQRSARRRGQREGFRLKMPRATGFMQPAREESPTAGEHGSPRHARKDTHIEQTIGKFGFGKYGVRTAIKPAVANQHLLASHRL